MQDFKKIILENSLQKDLIKGNFGIEKESLRVDKEGNLALTPHPEAFGDKSEHPYITVDFSESQVELISPKQKSVKEAYSFLENLHEILALTLAEQDEYIWSQSAPAILPEEEKIPIAHFPHNKELEEYREKLAQKYGKKKQLLSGIHFNFSFDEEFLQKFYKASGSQAKFKDFKNALYLKIARSYFKYNFLIIYLFGASPIVHKSYTGKCTDKMQVLTEDSFYCQNIISFRNGSCGYKNQDKFFVDYNSLEAYLASLDKAIEEGKISSAKEYYSSLRLKAKDPLHPLSSLEKDGIEYLEFRAIDLNPLAKIGIMEEDLEFLHLFILYLFLKKDEELTEENYFIFLENQEIVANIGKCDEFKIKTCCEKSLSAKDYTLKIIENIASNLEEIGLLTEERKRILNFQRDKILNKAAYIDQILKAVQASSFVDFHLEQAQKFLEEFQEKAYTLKGYEDLELSTQILLKEAIKIGLHFEILDRSDNFILLEKNGRKEYIKQATKTSLDTYISTLIMENKIVTKEVLKKENLRVPQGKNYQDLESALEDFELYKGAIVIKPKSTNYGLGITIFKDSFSKEDYKQALKLAFAEDNSVLIEEFIDAKEYRFLVLEDKVLGVLHRVPANVKGDGKSSIKELVRIKNLDPLRSKGYKTPLEYLNLGESEKLFLKMQNLDEDYIPKLDEVIYLRENSNISTGGDSLDFTDEVLQGYKDIAIQATKAVQAKICGVDILIKDIKDEKINYVILELNFNPAIHIHSYPYQGKRRKIARELLKALKFI